MIARLVTNLFRRRLRAPAVSSLLPALTITVMLAACSSSGPATTVNQPTSSPDTTAYNGPPAQTADIQSFNVSLWTHIRASNRCGGCHHEGAGGQSPMFARSDDVNLAYQAALPLVNLTQPSQSPMVLKVGGGHNCWVADPGACAQTLLTWINAWIGGSAASATSVNLVAPPIQSVGGTRLFPANSTDFQAKIYNPILRQFCVNCHRSNSSTPQSPFFASDDPDEAYLAAQPKINLQDPAQSRFVQRLGSEFHHCWAIPAGGGGPPDCAGSAQAMLNAITAYANGIDPTAVDPAMVLSKALQLTQGTIASGGNRSEANLVAKYAFETGDGLTAFDTSGVSPAADLQLYGSVTWAGGWGIVIGAGGKAQASFATSQKFAQTIQATGEYSIEAWVAPANVTQTEAYIVSYSGSDKTRNMTLAQSAQQYEGRTRSSVTDTNGSPPLVTAGGNAQAALQHVVLTYDPINGQKLYVNGAFTGDIDPSKGGSLANWDSTFALVLGSETTGKEQWLGLIKFVAIHSRALTLAQIQQNYAAGVGQKYYLLFDVSALSDIPQTYILMQGSQYDSYSYLFTNPTFFSLDPKAAPSNLVIAGMRVGMNGAIPSVGQSYATLNVTVGTPNYTAAAGQLLSRVGAVIPSVLPKSTDMLFLSFDQFGSHAHATTEPTYAIAGMPIVPASTAPQADRGIATFERIYRTMGRITGVPFTNQAVTTTYNSIQQSLPSSTQLAAFVASHQTAISQLAGTYCAQLVGNQQYRDPFFGASLGSSLTQLASAYFNTAGNRNIVKNALTNAIFGASAYPQAATVMSNQVDALLSTIPTVSSTATVSSATVAACTAALGSAAVTLQ